jgi:hypothetical protein
VGLEDMVSANDGNLVQVGTIGNWGCGIISCGFSYWPWYQVGATSSSQKISCGNLLQPFGPGDYVEADIGWSPSAKTNNYYIAFNDFGDPTNSGGAQCNFSTYVTYGMTPIIAPVIVERPTYCIPGACSLESLPQFGTVNFSACDITGYKPSNIIACNNTSTSNSGCGGGTLDWIKDDMYNTGTTNISVGSTTVSLVVGCYMGSFVETWASSSGT